MKNSINNFLVIGFLCLPVSLLFGQLEFDQVLNFEQFGFGYNSAYLYVAPSDNSMSIRKQSDLKISFDTKIDAFTPTYDDYYLSSYYYPQRTESVSNFKIGYSPLPYLYGTANLMLANEKEGTGQYDSRMVLADIGIGGYYLKETKDVFKKKNIFNKSSKLMMTQKGFLGNVLLGYSRGNISHAGQYRVGRSEFRLNRFYGKVGLDYQARYWGVAGDMKFGVINYGRSKIEGHAYEDLLMQRELLQRKNNFTFSEITFRFYVGIKYGQVYINGVATKVNSELSDFVVTDYLSVGAVLDFQEIFKKKEKE